MFDENYLCPIVFHANAGLYSLLNNLIIEFLWLTVSFLGDNTIFSYLV